MGESTWKVKLLAALAIVYGHLEEKLGQAETEKTLDDLVEGLADGLVEGIEFASPPMLSAGEKFVLPWVEKKGVGAAESVVHTFLAKYQAKALASIPAPGTGATPEQAADAVNKL